MNALHVGQNIFVKLVTLAWYVASVSTLYARTVRFSPERAGSCVPLVLATLDPKGERGVEELISGTIAQFTKLCIYIGFTNIYNDLCGNRRVYMIISTQTSYEYDEIIETFLIGVGDVAQPVDFPFDQDKCYGTRKLRGSASKKYHHFRGGSCLRAPIGTVTVAEQTPYFGSIKIPFCETCFWRLQYKWPHSRLVRY